jgi:hypothetical protein
MPEQLDLDFTAGDRPATMAARQSWRRAWTEANRVVREKPTGRSGDAQTGEEDLLSRAKRAGAEATETGFEAWQREQRERNNEFARRLGLPLGRRVEVVLHGGTTLRGLLSLGSPGKKRGKLPPGPAANRATRTLLPLLVGSTPVTAGEIASCVGLDNEGGAAPGA